MFFFNDECDLIDDDQYDLFTLATDVERRSNRFLHRGPGGVKPHGCKPLLSPAPEFVAPEGPTQSAQSRQQHKLMRL
ncbi:MAG: hypothetical protein WAM65_08265 [Candidatus Korobacteraceae bacterium]